MGVTKRAWETIYLDPFKLDLLKKLAERTRIPRAVLAREAIDDLLVKYHMLDSADAEPPSDAAKPSADPPPYEPTAADEAAPSEAAQPSEKLHVAGSSDVSGNHAAFFPSWRRSGQCSPVFNNGRDQWAKVSGSDEVQRCGAG
jgi:hypothetical protein